MDLPADTADELRAMWREHELLLRAQDREPDVLAFARNVVDVRFGF
jgi:hypothetical protein